MKTCRALEELFVPARTTRIAALALAAGLALAGCTDVGGPQEDEDATPEPTVEPGPGRAELQEPGGPATVLAQDDPAALALAASTTFFASAPVVVLAEADDLDAVLRGAGAGVALAAPVLLTGDDASVAAELDRLGAEAVLAFGDAQLPTTTDVDDGADDGAGDDADDAESAPVGEQDIDLVPAPRDDAELADLLGLSAGEPVTMSRTAEIAGLMELTRGNFSPVQIDEASYATDGESGEANETDGESTDAAESDGEPEPDDVDSASDAETESGTTAEPGGGQDGTAPDDEGTADPGTAPAGVLPQTEPAEPLEGVLALSSGSSSEAAAVATASAAGAQLAVAPQGDPRATSESVTAVSDAGAGVVVGLGAAFGDDETLGWRVATAATGTELPGGGQLVFPDKRYVALYGTPSTTALGVLGEQDVPATIERAAEHAADYDDLSDDEVIPALEIITTVASSGAGSDGNYSNELPAESLRPLIEAAQEAGQYVLLDLQPGRSSFLEQAQHYQELLEYPHVGLALDPEWNLGPDERHMVQIGSTTSEEVNEVVDWLADFTQKAALPQKMLVLHQFQVRMIQTVADVDLSRSEIAVLVHADGQGGQSAKQGTWATLHANAPDIQWWGWKNFYDEDIPMLTPEETAQVVPFPHFISYQ